MTVSREGTQGNDSASSSRFEGTVMGERVVIGVLVGAALLVRVAFAFAVPALQAPDEQAHFRYVAHLREYRELPIQPERSLEMFADPMHQAYQPPLAYLLFVPLEQWLTASEAKAVTRLRAVRIQNAIYGAATVLVGVLLAARLTRRGDPRRLLVGVVLAFFPGFVAVGSAANNDSLANLLAAVLWLTLIPRDGRTRSAWRAGLALGAACLAKLTSLTLVPLLFVVPLLQRRGDVRGALRFALVAGAVAAIPMLPWILHNVSVYGNPLAIGVGSLSTEWLATVLPTDQLALATRPRLDNAFFQFWGRFGIANNLAWSGVPVVLVTLALLALVGWIRARVPRPPDQFERWAPTFVVAVALAVGGLFYFSLGYVGAWQGRYLYGAMLPVALLLAGGWARWLPDTRWWAPVVVVALSLLAVDVIALVKLHQFFATQPPASWILFTRL
jgi:hypothetical protein